MSPINEGLNLTFIANLTNADDIKRSWIGENNKTFNNMNPDDRKKSFLTFSKSVCERTVNGSLFVPTLDVMPRSNSSADTLMSKISRIDFECGELQEKQLNDDGNITENSSSF